MNLEFTREQIIASATAAERALGLNVQTIPVPTGYRSASEWGVIWGFQETKARQVCHQHVVGGKMKKQQIGKTFYFAIA